MRFEILNIASHVKNRKRGMKKCFHEKYAQSTIAILLKERCIFQRCLDREQIFAFAWVFLIYPLLLIAFPYAARIHS